MLYPETASKPAAATMYDSRMIDATATSDVKIMHVPKMPVDVLART